MSRWGEVDKKSIVYVLDEGLKWLKEELKEPSQPAKTNLNDFYDLEELLYGEGRDLLSYTNQKRFEKRLNTIRKSLDKWQDNN